MENMTSKELKVMAKELGVKNWWNLKKVELIAEIQKIQDAAENDENVADDKNIVDESSNESESAQEADKKQTGWERIAKNNIKNAYNQIVGGYENSVTDGAMEESEFKEWLKENAFDDVYREAMSTAYGDGWCGGKAPTEMRFAGKEFCETYLKLLFEKDGYSIADESPEAPEKPSNKKQDLIEYNSKTQSLSAWARELNMPGQTLYARLHISNWPVEKAFTTPSRRKKTEEEA